MTFTIIIRKNLKPPRTLKCTNLFADRQSPFLYEYLKKSTEISISYSEKELNDINYVCNRLNIVLYIVYKYEVK